MSSADFFYPACKVLIEHSNSLPYNRFIYHIYIKYSDILTLNNCPTYTKIWTRKSDNQL